MKPAHLILIALVLFLGACRKDRTCNCTVTKEGTTTTRNQTAGTSITISPLPPIEIVTPMDTTIVTPFNNSSEQTTVFKDVKARTAKYNCVSFEETISENSVQTIPGTATITTSQAGKKTYSCKLE
jgi:hypothetical protein